MTAYILCAVLVTAGLFFLTDTRPRDVTRELKKPFENEVNRNLRTVRTDNARCSGGRKIRIFSTTFRSPTATLRTRRIRKITGKKPSPAQRMMEEAVTMLDASGMGEQVATYRNMAILLAVSGFLFGMVIDNILVSLVLSLGLAVTPLTVIRLRSADYGRMVNEKLEMAMSSVTNSYVATGNLLIAVERVLPMLPAPVNDIFKRFQVDMQYVDGNTVRAIQHMREPVNNWYWQEWCNALIQCQDDVSLNRTLSGIVERLSEMRQIQMEVDTTLRKHMSDYVVTVMLVLGSIPLMGFMIPDWYDMLMNTLPGKITLAIVLATVLITSVWVSRAQVPAEGVESE